MKTRNEIYGGTFSSPETPDTNTNGELKKLVLSDSADITKNRSSWIRTILYNILDSFTHKTEDRATGSNIGVSGTGIESTQTVYTTPEQLPEVSKVVDDFTISSVEADGNLTATQDMFEISVVNTDRKNKSFNVSFSNFGIKWLLARTRQQTQLEELITTVTTTITTNATRVGTITYTAHTTDDDASKNLIIDTRTLGKGSSGADLNDDKYETLWKHLYDKYPDAICTLNVARTTRDADWTANRTLTLPKIYGRVIIGKDSTQTEFDTIGEIGGEKTHLLTGAEAAQKAVSVTLDAGTNSLSGVNPPAFVVIETRLDPDPVGGLTINIPASNAVSAHNVLNPYVALNPQITY